MMERQKAELRLICYRFMSVLPFCVTAKIVDWCGLLPLLPRYRENQVIVKLRILKLEYGRV